jgi:hypothetical protein
MRLVFFKSNNHKYIRREGFKGNYTYVYAEPETNKQKKLVDEIPVKNLNKDIDFKANEKFLNEEIEEVWNKKLNEKNIISGYKKDFENKYNKKFFDFVVNDIKNNKDNLEDLLIEYEKKDSSIKNDAETYRDVIVFLESIKYDNYVTPELIQKTKQFCEGLTPVHSCSLEKFERILNSGGLKSLEELKQSGIDKVKRLIKDEIGSKYGNDVSEYVNSFFEADSETAIDEIYKELLSKDSREFGNIINDWKKLRLFQEDLKDLKNKLKEDSSGAIAYEVDKKLGTNKHVFSLMGTNTSYCDISIVLKKEIMEHPDFSMTPVAGTSFESGRNLQVRKWTLSSINNLKKITIGENEYGFYRKTLKTENHMHFDKSKLNKKQNPNYSEYMAKDLLMQDNHPITEQNTITQYLNRESHGRWEAHLPSFVPLNMIEEVVIKQKDYEFLVSKTILNGKGIESQAKKINNIIFEIYPEDSKDWFLSRFNLTKKNPNHSIESIKSELEVSENHLNKIKEPKLKKEMLILSKMIDEFDFGKQKGIKFKIVYDVKKYQDDKFKNGGYK